MPARSACIGPIDKLFTRIGANDDLASGRSTFMVEMTETAFILRQATSKSLILIDEIGRGTSTNDGMSLAYATCAFIAEKINAYTLFSTHYFELTELPQQFPNICNYHVKACINQNRIVFLYHVEAGHANRSYGLDVARLAGIPEEVLHLATSYLNALPSIQISNATELQKPKQSTSNHEPSPMAVLLAKINPDHLSAREALDLIYQLKTLESA